MAEKKIKNCRASNLVLKTFETPPTAHDERVIGSYHGDDIDSLCFELFVLLKVRGQMVRVASRLVGSVNSNSDIGLGKPIQ